MIKKGNLHWLLLSVVMIALDQWTKHLAMQHFSVLHPYHVFPFFDLTLAYNTGAAFSFLTTAGGWQRWFFVITGISICIGIIVWLIRMPRDHRWLAISLAFILGGAIGNLWDRITLGYVVDFIDLYIQHWHWPIFNVADSAVSVGVIMLLIDLMFSPRAKDS